MSSTRRTLVLFSFGLAFCASSVLGNSGPNQQIVVKNESSVQVGFTTDANSSAIQAALLAQSTSQFTSAGGVFLNAGASHTFAVQAGTYTLGASNWSNAATGAVLTQVTFIQSVAANQSVNVYVHGSAAPVVLTINNTP